MNLITYQTKEEIKTIMVEVKVHIWYFQELKKQDREIIILNVVEVEDSKFAMKKINESDYSSLSL